MGVTGGPTLQRSTDGYGEWVKVFRHKSSNFDFFSNANDWEEAKQTNTSNPDGVKYSILSEWRHFLRNGKYTLKLDYPSNSVTNIWSQTSNPVDSNGSGGVIGYVAISIDSNSSGWGGLERYDSQQSTFLDGTLIPQSNWWWAIGSRNTYDSGNPNFPGPGFTVEEVELWMLDKSV